MIILEESMSSETLYNYLISSYTIIFLENDKIRKMKKNKTNFCNFSRKPNFSEGCTVFPIELKNRIIDYIAKLNKLIKFYYDKNLRIKDSNGNDCYSICFEQGDIINKKLYKKIVVSNKILYCPSELYQLKMTEYKIRGFCQIMEEMGAELIDIKFVNNNETTTEKNIKVNTNTGMSAFAGSLGFVSTDQKKSNDEMSYQLNYNNNNAIILDIKKIENNIKRKKYIVI